MDMNGDPGSDAMGTSSNRGTQWDMAPAAHSDGEQNLLSVENDNRREGENGNSSITFMMDVKTDLRGRADAE